MHLYRLHNTMLSLSPAECIVCVQMCVSESVHMCAANADPHRHSVTPVTSAPLPLTTGEGYRRGKGLFCHSTNTPLSPPSLYRCVLLGDDQRARCNASLQQSEAETREDQIAWFVSELSCSALSFRFALSCLTLPLFQSNALPSPLLLSTSSSPIFYPPLPPLPSSLLDRKCEMS